MYHEWKAAQWPVIYKLFCFVFSDQILYILVCGMVMNVSALQTHTHSPTGNELPSSHFSLLPLMILWEKVYGPHIKLSKEWEQITGKIWGLDNEGCCETAPLSEVRLFTWSVITGKFTWFLWGVFCCFFCSKWRFCIRAELYLGCEH